MALHDSLRDLVTQRGPGVLDEAEEFRGVLDDFLAEDEATLGELNLLVDAVRLGALRRVLDVVAHGAAPEAAVREAGAALARDRGTDDPTRSCWALASLCFALGKVDESMVRLFRGDAGTVPAATPPTAPNGPAPGVVPGHHTAERPETQVLSNQAPVSQPVVAQAPPTAGVQSFGAPPQYAGPVPPVIREEKSSRAGVFLLVVLVALLLGGLVAAGFILLRSNGDSDDDPPAGDGQTSEGRTSDGPREEPLVSDDEMLVPYRADDGTSRIYAVNAIDGGFRTVLTAGPIDVLPSLSPDRRTMTYLVGPAPLTLMRFDLESAGFEPFFSEQGPCDHALRPGWSLDGSQIALSCTGDDELTDGIWIADADGNLDQEPVVDDSLVRGSPTWVSDTEFIYGRQDDESDDAPLTFWSYNTTNGVKVQLDIGIEGLQLTHADYSPEVDKVLFLVSPRGEREIGDVWTMDPDGSNARQIADGAYAHPVWSPDGTAIGVTVFTRLPDDEEDDPGAEELGYLPLADNGDAEAPVLVPDPPPGDVGIPVWATR